jgi:hypothetical protein
MPAKSSTQQRAAGMALAVKKGEIPLHKVQGPVRNMVKSMSTAQLKEFASHRKMRG